MTPGRRRAAGIDYLADVVKQVAAVPYDSDDLTVALQVGATSYTIRARHKWRLNSMLNPTHGIEQASRFDKGACLRCRRRSAYPRERIVPGVQQRRAHGDFGIMWYV
jgi:hypothetical protein